MTIGRSAGAFGEAARASLRQAGGAALDWLYPPQCVACEEVAAESGGLCAACWRETPFLGPDACPRCGSAAGAGIDEATAQALARLGPDQPLCVDCPRRAVSWRRARAAARYEGVARQLVLALKEGDRIDAAPSMARRMAQAARLGGLGPGRGEADPMLAPVPLHWRRRLARRFNQSAVLARALARETGWPLALKAFRRVRATPRQTRLSGEERRRDLSEAFVWTPAAAALAGRRVILVDDVMTTGATLDAVAKRALEAGARAVDALVYARSGLADPALGGAATRWLDET